MDYWTTNRKLEPFFCTSCLWTLLYPNQPRALEYALCFFIMSPSKQTSVTREKPWPGSFSHSYSFFLASPTVSDDRTVLITRVFVSEWHNAVALQSFATFFWIILSILNKILDLKIHCVTFHPMDWIKWKHGFHNRYSAFCIVGNRIMENITQCIFKDINKSKFSTIKPINMQQSFVVVSQTQNHMMLKAKYQT